MSWCFVTQTVFSLDLNGTCIETLHEMATFVLETPHQNTECQLQGCHDSSLTNFNIPPPSLLNAFCRKESTFKKKQQKKRKQSRTGIPYCQPTQMEVFFILFKFFEEQYKVLLSKPVADKKKKKRRKDSLSGNADSGLI